MIHDTANQAVHYHQHQLSQTSNHQTTHYHQHQLSQVIRQYTTTRKSRVKHQTIRQHTIISIRSVIHQVIKKIETPHATNLLVSTPHTCISIPASRKSRFHKKGLNSWCELYSSEVPRQTSFCTQRKGGDSSKQSNFCTHCFDTKDSVGKSTGTLTHSKSSCLSSAYLNANTIIGINPSHPSIITLTLCRVEYGNSLAVGTRRSVHTLYDPTKKIKTYCKNRMSTRCPR